MAVPSCVPTRRVSFCDDAGMPVIGSRRVLKCAMLHDGVIRRSDDEFGEVMRRGMSAAAA